jgi:N-methylhydantoinase B
MNITMRRTTRSVVAKETNDFSSAILDPSGTPVALAMPYGLRVFCHAVPHMIAKFKGTFRPGDVIISNDPYRGTSHLPDIVAIMPIFFEDELVGFSATYQHHTDIGGRFPGGYGNASRELYEEGLQLPIVHFYEAGQPNRSVHDIIGANVRAPEDVLGDLEANSAACRRGAAGMLRLFEQYGTTTVLAACHHFLDASESFLRGVLAEIPDGEYRVEGLVDDGEDLRFPLVLTASIEADHLVIDFTGSADQVAGSCNVPPGMALDGILNTLFGLLTRPDVVVNGGLLRPIAVVAPQGSVLNPTFPAAVAQRGLPLFVLTDMMLDALAMAVPGRFPATSDGGHPILIYSSDPEGGAPSVLIDIWCGGWGARPTSDGIDGVVMMAMIGFRNSSAELLELSSMLSLEGFGFVPDTGGRGEYRGCVSLFRRYRINRSGRVMLRTPRCNAVGVGREGGGPGGPFTAKLIRDGVETILPKQMEITLYVRPGDIVEHVGAGGGGYGDPLRRDPRRVLDDVLDEKVSIEQADVDYGVVVDTETMTIDEPATARRRQTAGSAP